LKKKKKKLAEIKGEENHLQTEEYGNWFKEGTHYGS